MRRALAVVLLLLAVPAVARAGWKDTLEGAVRGCDRVRVRSGGTCHRSPAEEKTLFEAKGAAAVRSLLAAIDIDEAASGGGCMCCGEPTFEFYRGDRLVAMVGFHHGVALRWADGSWTGDGALTRDSALGLCRWLAKHGVEGPLEALEESMARERAMQERWRRYREILDARTMAALERARGGREAQAALLGVSPGDPAARVVVWFRLFGCHEGSWSHYTNPDQVIEKLLEQVPPEVMGQAMARIGKDAWALTGAARFVLDGRHEKLVPPDALASALPALAARAFAHPNRDCRRSAMAGVARIGGDVAVAALRRVVAGDVTIRKLPEADRVDPAGMVCFRPTAAEVREPGDDRVVAAWLLHGLGAEVSDEAIAALLEKAEGRDRGVLESIREK